MTAVSGADGIFRFDNIPVGTWVVRELIPAEGFVLNEQSYQVTITEHEQVIEITLENRYIRSDILGHKVDEDGQGNRRRSLWTVQGRVRRNLPRTPPL